MSEATFDFDGVILRGEIDESGNGVLWGQRDREYGDQYLSGTRTTVTTSVVVENFRAVLHGDKRIDLGPVVVTGG